jgi:hypothetical protein
MNVERFPAERLRRFLRKHTIATLPELKDALGTPVDMTVFRKLKALSSRTSYSHGSRYYALDEIVDFDAQGLWSHRGVWFSRQGTLLASLEDWVRRSEAGGFAAELEERLHVGVKESLLKLVQQGSISRERLEGRYLYCASESSVRRRQVAARVAAAASAAGVGVPDEAKAAVLLFMSLLDEKQRRLYAGVESLRLGRGGDGPIAELLGLHPQTVARGRRELLARDVEIERTRRAGGGRKPVEKKRRRSSRGSKR